MKRFIFILLISISVSFDSKSQDVYTEIDIKNHEGLFKLANEYLKNGADSVFGFEYLKTYISYPNSDSNFYNIDKGYFFIVKSGNQSFTEKRIYYDNGKSIIKKTEIKSNPDSLEILGILRTKDKSNFMPSVILSKDSSGLNYYYVVLANDLHAPSQAVLFLTREMQIFNYILTSSFSKKYIDYDNLNYNFNTHKPLFMVFKFFYKKCFGFDFDENQF